MGEPSDSDVEVLAAKVRSLETLLGETFASVSCLREAYLQMQAAIDSPQKLYLAANAVGLELKKLSELKHKYRWKVPWHHASPRLKEESEVREGSEESRSASAMAIQGLKAELQRKDAEIEALQVTVERLVSKKERRERRARKGLERNRGAKTPFAPSHRSGGHAAPTDAATPLTHMTGGLLRDMFTRRVRDARAAGIAFAKLLAWHLKRARLDLDVLSVRPAAGVAYAEARHQRLALQSYTFLRMFSGFENESFYMSGRLSSILEPVKHRNDCLREFSDMQFMDPLELLGITPDCSFGKFCHKKFLHIVHTDVEAALFGSRHEHRACIADGGHPRTRFYEVFACFAKAVWLVHKLAFCFQPFPATTFYAAPGADFRVADMESAVGPNLEMASETPNLLPKVAFTVIPGFRTGTTTLLPCQVYLDGMKASKN